MRLRDHSQPCEHTYPLTDGNLTGADHDDGYWQCWFDECPGGKEITVETLPWCAEHDAEWPDEHNQCWRRDWDGGNPCRLEEPARHYVMEEQQ